MARNNIPHLTVLKKYKQKSCPFAVLPVRMQKFLILILQLPFSYSFNFYVPLYYVRIKQFVQNNKLIGTKQIVAGKQLKVSATFGALCLCFKTVPK